MTAFVDVITSAVAWFCLLMLSALACLTLGVYLIAGPGYMFIVLGACLFGLGWFLRIGIVTHG